MKLDIKCFYESHAAKVMYVPHYIILLLALFSVIQKDGLNFAPLYFLNYTRYVNDLHNI